MAVEIEKEIPVIAITLVAEQMLDARHELVEFRKIAVFHQLVQQGLGVAHAVRPERQGLAPVFQGCGRPVHLGKDIGPPLVNGRIIRKAALDCVHGRQGVARAVGAFRQSRPGTTRYRDDWACFLPTGESWRLWPECPAIRLPAAGRGCARESAPD